MARELGDERAAGKILQPLGMAALGEGNADERSVTWRSRSPSRAKVPISAAWSRRLTTSASSSACRDATARRTNCSRARDRDRENG